MQGYTFKDNPSSDTIVKVLDNLIAMMLEPLVRYTDYGFEMASSILCLLQDNRRKLTNKDRNKIVVDLMLCFCTRDRDALYESIIDAEIERSMIIGYVGTFLASSHPPKLIAEYEPLRRHLTLLLDMYNRFTMAVVKLYTKVVQFHSNRVVAVKGKFGVIVHSDDAFQNAQMHALKSLSRFRSTSGTVSNYLLKWVNHSDSSPYLIGIGESYEITRNQRTKIARGTSSLNNLAVDIEKSLHVPDEAMTQEEQLHHDETMIKWLKFVSRSTVGRSLPLAMVETNTHYILSDKERQQLRDTNGPTSKPE